jgi:hypothetical protein
MQNLAIAASRTTRKSVRKLKIQKKNSTNDKKDSAKSELGSTESNNIRNEEGKRGAREPLYLLRYE